MDCTQSDCSYELLVWLSMFASPLYCQANLSLFIHQLISEKRIFIHILSLFPSSLPPYSLAFYIVLLCNTRWTWNALLALNSTWSCFRLLSARFTAGSHNAQIPFLFLCSPLTFEIAEAGFVLLISCLHSGDKCVHCAQFEVSFYILRMLHLKYRVEFLWPVYYFALFIFGNILWPGIYCLLLI